VINTCLKFVKSFSISSISRYFENFWTQVQTAFNIRLNFYFIVNNMHLSVGPFHVIFKYIICIIKMVYFFLQCKPTVPDKWILFKQNIINITYRFFF